MYLDAEAGSVAAQSCLLLMKPCDFLAEVAPTCMRTGHKSK